MSSNSLMRNDMYPEVETIDQGFRSLLYSSSKMELSLKNCRNTCRILFI